MNVRGEDILKTLIELLEAQEQIKITYKIGEGGGRYVVRETLSTPKNSFRSN